MLLLGIIPWMVVGLVTGYLTSLIAHERNEGIALDVVVGMVGAVVAGWFFSTVEPVGVKSLNILGLCVAAGGAVVLLVGWNIARGHTARA
jgi:uncharacterized membrane protein YeaQ/YmgE (transglycosylase-associated protein family)